MFFDVRSSRGFAATHAVFMLCSSGLFVGGCGQSPTNGPIGQGANDGALSVTAPCPQAPDADRYRVFSQVRLGNETLAPIWDDEYAEVMRAGNMTPLWCGAAEGEVYRLVWLPPFRSSLVITARHVKDKWEIEVVEFLDPSLGLPGTRRQGVTRRSAVTTPDAHVAVADLSASLARAKFWTAPTVVRSNEREGGATGILEGRVGMKYRLLLRDDSQDLAFYDVLRSIVLLANQNMPYELEQAGR